MLDVKWLQTLVSQVNQLVIEYGKRNSPSRQEIHLKLCEVYMLLSKALNIIRDTCSNIIFSKKTVVPGHLEYSAVVQDEQDIPNSPLYYIESTNEFAVRVNGVVIKGNVGEIFTKLDSDLKQKVVPCQKRKCPRTRCSFWHQNEVRNFLNTQWLYKPQPSSSKIVARSVGNRSTLLTDSSVMSQAERELHNNQTMHDILVQLVLHQTSK